MLTRLKLVLPLFISPFKLFDIYKKKMLNNKIYIKKIVFSIIFFLTTYYYYFIRAKLLQHHVGIHLCCWTSVVVTQKMNKKVIRLTPSRPKQIRNWKATEMPAAGFHFFEAKHTISLDSDWSERKQKWQSIQDKKNPLVTMSGWWTSFSSLVGLGLDIVHAL